MRLLVALVACVAALLGAVQVQALALRGHTPRPLLLPVVRASAFAANPDAPVSFLVLEATTGRLEEEKLSVLRMEDVHNRDDLVNKVLGRRSSNAGLINYQGTTREKNKGGLNVVVDDPDQKEEREKLNGVDWTKEGMPEPDDYKRQHAIELAHHEIDIRNLKYDDIYRERGADVEDHPYVQDEPFVYRGAAQRFMTDNINPDPPVIHPGVHPLAPRARDYSNTGADFETAPPDPMPPQPPYLYPEHVGGEFNYNVPPMYRAFYPTTEPSAHPPTGSTDPTHSQECVPVKDLPYVRSLAPSKLQDDFCVPAKFLPYYHPDVSPQLVQQGGAATGENGLPSQTMQPLVSSPQFDLPMPFAHGPMFPPFHPPGPGEPSINPPPMVPLPAPANFNGNARRMPAMPMPPLPPAMWPYG